MAFGGNFAQLVDKRPSGIVFSPTQVEKYDRCKRAWAFEYIGGLRAPPKPSAELGILVHAILEAWLTYGTPPDTTTKAGKIAAKMIVHLPLPGTGITERNFYLVTRNGFAYTGKIDWSGIFWNWPTVVDHKTTGNLSWAKTEAGLHCDTQGISYTIAGCYGFEVDEIQLLWNYGTTKDRDPIINPVRTKIRLPIAEEKFERVIEPLAAEMLSARTSRINPHNFPPNPHACGDFGGCPHRHICQLTQEERALALMTDQQNPTLAARLSTMPQGGFMPPGNGAPAYAPMAQMAPGFTPPGNGYVQPQPQPQQQGFVPPQQGFTPPQNGAPQQGYVQQPAPFNPNMGPNAPEMGTQMPAAPMPQQAMQQPNGAPEPEKKRGRGRPKKVEGEATAATDGGTAQAAYLAGVAAWMVHPNWNGQLDQLIWAGDMAVQAFHARFG